MTASRIAEAVLSLVALLTLSHPAAVAQTTNKAREIYAAAADSVLVIYVRAANGDLVAQGSGFWVEGKRVVTNAHVIESGQVVIQFGPAIVRARIEHVDTFNDLAVLTVDVEVTATPLSLATDEPAVGDTVFAIGSPKGLERTLSQGVVSAKRNLSGRQLLQVTSPISQGSSGSPIFDANGKVVGVVMGTLPEGQNLNFAVPARLVQELLAGKAAAGTMNSLALLDRIQSAVAERNQEEYSDDVNSTWQQKDREVKVLFQQALEHVGEDADALLRLAEAATWENADTAVLAARRSVKIRASAQALLVLARAASASAFGADERLKVSLLTEAEKSVRTALTLSRPPSPETYYLLADILKAKGSCAEAEQYFRSALDAGQRASDKKWESATLRGLTSCARTLGRRAEVIRWLDMLQRTGKITRWDWRGHATWLAKQQEYRNAGDAYQSAAQSTGGAYADWCSAADMYSFASEEDLVLFAARSCIQGGLGEQDAVGTLARAHQQIADVLNRRGVFSEALTHAKEATALDPSDSLAFDSLAASLLGLRRFHEAETAAKQALKLSDGKYGWMHFRLGSIYFDMENWLAARQEFEKAAELSPQDPAAAYNVAVCNGRLGSYLDAATWYEEYLRRKPNATDRADILERIRIFRSR